MKRVVGAILLVCISPICFAHGEDVLVTIYGDALVVALFFVSLLFLKIDRSYKAIGALLFFIGYMFVWAVTADMPFNKNKLLINAIHWGIPSFLWSGTVVFAIYRERRRR